MRIAHPAVKIEPFTQFSGDAHMNLRINDPLVFELYKGTLPLAYGDPVTWGKDKEEEEKEEEEEEEEGIDFILD